CFERCLSFEFSTVLFSLHSFLSLGICPDLLCSGSLLLLCPIYGVHHMAIAAWHTQAGDPATIVQILIVVSQLMIDG
ncbi:MAG: hypothetical protein NW220_18215, partial [Leptolyngbyaceae cyanobacterium bins.349]|nr:hypothetical protein [Leptolyngbyaceae cyanobacterium bins.349]